MGTDAGTTMPPPAILPVREQSALITEMVRERLESILPAAMTAGDLDMWIVLCQEDNPDPLFPTMIPFDNWHPILSCLVFAREGDRVHRYNLSACDTKDLYVRPYTGQLEERQWPALIDLVQQHDPARIGINTGSVAWVAGGLTWNLHRQLVERLPDRYRERLVSAEPAAVRWASTLTQLEMVIYRRVSEIGQYMIRECFTSRTITPGVTTIDDLVWHYWQLANDLGLDVAFRPYFRIHRDERQAGLAPETIAPGDVLHCDVGIKYLRLNSDHQHVAYVLRRGEMGPPAGLVARMEETNRLQDVFLAGFERGRSGNEMLAWMLREAHARGVPQPKVYSHNTGLFLHQPGPLIGLPWEQEPVLPRGDVRLENDSTFVMELSTTGPVPEWGGQPLTLSLEEPVLFTGGTCQTVCARQTAWHVI